MTNFFRIAASTVLAAFVAPVLASADDAAAPIEFNRDIRPILSDHCYACHGPDANKREAELRLDTEAGLRGAGDHPGVVVPFQLEESELYRRVSSGDEAERMPPVEFTKPLSAEQIDLLRRWIEQGAVWEGHWSFQPVRDVEPPARDEGDAFSLNAIDAFTRPVMAQHGLAPSAPADRRTLIRRVSFDLTGLPPTAEQVERFVNDGNEAAYEQLVDELLASPRFGERMAMWWLDLVRYADTVGYHGDQNMKIHPFREYVIRSFNENKPFDQFTVEQLAGDLLPEPTREQLIASGYNRLGMMSAEGGVQDREYLAKYIAERVRNLGGAWLGVTLGCCECHDHKYDPFTMRDFYSLEAFFADIQEQGIYGGAHETGVWGPSIQVPSPEQEQQLAEFDRQIADVQLVLDTQTPELDAAQLEWEAGQLPWQVLRPDAIASLNGTTLTLQEDGSILASGESPATDTYTLTLAPAGGDAAGAEAPQASRRLTALRIEVLPDDSLPQKGPGRAGNGNFVLSEIELFVIPGEAGAAPIPVPLQNATATYEQTGAAETNPYGKWAVAAIIDGDAQGPTWGWAVMEQAGRANSAVVETAADLEVPAGASLQLVLKQNLDNPQHTLGRFRVSGIDHPRPVTAAGSPPPEIETLLAIAPDERSDAQRQQVSAHFRSITELLAPARQQLAELQSARQALDATIPVTLVTRTVEPRTIRILARGNWMDESGEVMLPAFPAVLSAPMSLDAEEGRRLNRLDLARWVVAPDNPLTARVFVNRMWKLMFGAGLSRKLDDLGAQGEWPSHPELLDWLAREFQNSGWDVKHLLKLMVMSATYRQQSEAADAVRELDPYNRWLSHQSPFRLDAEMVRDNALTVSGLLVEQVGGPSVFPYQPAGYWAHLNFPIREWQNSTGESLYRRSLYTHWQRQYLHPSMSAFDAPSREECTAERARSNTPLQSLVLLNDPIFVESSRVFAARLLAGEADTAERLNRAFVAALSRPIRPAEAEVLSQLLEKHRAEYAADPASAAALLSIGESPLPEGADPVELAAWTSITRVLFNLHESVTRN
jgi:hypothetical protein